MTVWHRIDRDTIEADFGNGGLWQIRVVGENASGKPNRWGVYQRTQITGRSWHWTEVRSKPSNIPRLRKWNPSGSHVTFDTMRSAKLFVERKAKEAAP